MTSSQRLLSRFFQASSPQTPSGHRRLHVNRAAGATWMRSVSTNAQALFQQHTIGTHRSWVFIAKAITSRTASNGLPVCYGKDATALSRSSLTTALMLPPVVVFCTNNRRYSSKFLISSSTVECTTPFSDISSTFTELNIPDRVKIYNVAKDSLAPIEKPNVSPENSVTERAKYSEMLEFSTKETAKVAFIDRGAASHISIAYERDPAITIEQPTVLCRAIPISTGAITLLMND
ncbi:hypothetical protein BDV96DRAFT_635734 [Lophiotrema nucula]|uniref:Uncharacterized protein n=1 Tax=Lophiotrema nucula TaxID=690887 RepID=A0A6A5YSV4_9PLEO|nr:hypothetical protein BDV96DRAFT_635734 [Lophiotrema nucula]